MWLQNQRSMQCKPSSLFAVRYIRTKQNQQCPIGKKTMKKILKLNYRRNMTQQKQFFKAAAWLVSAILLTACTHDGDLDGGNHQTHERLQFNLSFAQFNADKEAVNGTKAKVRAVSAPQTIDLGNGLELEMTAERDAPEPPTRATPLYDGHYTILAINNAGNRVGKIKGTVTSGNFTRDEDEKLDLFDGQQYTFVCFNSAVTDDGTNLKFDDLNLHPAEQDMPLIGRVTWTVHPGQNFIPFEMKRQVGRVRFKLTTYTADAQNAKINLTTVHWHNRKATYHPGANAYVGVGEASAPIDENPVYGASGVAYDAMVKAHEQTTPYYYFLGNDVAGAGFIIGDSYLQFTSGTAYGKALPTTKYHIGTIFNASSDNFTSNSSYTFTIKVKSKDPLLLFQDGTVGYYGDHTTARMPIGLVTKEKTSNTDKGTAMALRDADGGTLMGYGQWGSRMFVYNNTKQYEENFSDAADDMDGYKWTYDPAGSADGTVKANNNSDYTIYSYAASYSPGISVASTVGKWYLPAMGEWMQAFTYLTGKTFQYGSYIQYIDNVDFAKLNKGFEDAGGTGVITQSGGVYTVRIYWTSSEIKGSYLSHPMAILDFSGGQRKIYIGVGSKHNGSGCVRPFVHF